jgi:hypothetical protein
MRSKNIKTILENLPSRVYEYEEFQISNEDYEEKFIQRKEIFISKQFNLQFLYLFSNLDWCFQNKYRNFVVLLILLFFFVAKFDNLYYLT